VLLSVWADVGEHMRQHLDSFTLADMVSRSRGQGPSSPDAAPTFADELRLDQPVAN
jgi:Rrf2 family iron-sulfur cluster assembly transcriptional regulator